MKNIILISTFILLSAKAFAGSCFITKRCGTPVIDMRWGPASGDWGKVVDVKNVQECVDRGISYMKEYQPDGKCELMKANATAHYQDGTYQIKTKIKLNKKN